MANKSEYEVSFRRAALRDDFRLTGWYARNADKYAAATSLMSLGILEGAAPARIMPALRPADSSCSK